MNIRVANMSFFMALLVSPISGLTLKSRSSDPASLTSWWQERETALENGDVDHLVTGYAEDSVVLVFDDARGKMFKLNGTDDIRRLHQSLLASKWGKERNEDMIQLDPLPQGGGHSAAGGMAFSQTRCEKCGISRMIEHMFLNEEGSISAHSIVVSCAGKSRCLALFEPFSDKPTAKLFELFPERKAPVVQGAKYHDDAFMKHDLQNMSKAYGEDGDLTLVDIGRKAMFTFTAEDGFPHFWNKFPTTKTPQPLTETGKKYGADGVEHTFEDGATFQVLAWSGEADGWTWGTDMFFYREDGILLKQSICGERKNSTGGKPWYDMM